MRIAVFTLEALAAAEAVSHFIPGNAAQIGFVGLSDPYRPATGGMLGQTIRHVRRSGLGFLPYLIANFSVPPMANALGRGPVLPGAMACQLGIPMLKVTDVNSLAMHEALRSHRIDLILSFHFDQIFRAETLAVAPLGGINIHPSLLPHHRGPVPTLHALADGGPFGVTIHRLAAKIDAGGILAQPNLERPAGLSSIGLAAAAHLAALAPPALSRLSRSRRARADARGGGFAGELGRFSKGLCAPKLTGTAGADSARTTSPTRGDRHQAGSPALRHRPVPAS